MRITQNKGYSIIEVMIAISIFAVGVLAVALMMEHSSLSGRSAGEVQEATQWAEEYLERTLGTPYLNMATFGDTAAGQPEFRTPDQKYTITVRITPNPPVAGSTANIDVIVGWAAALKGNARTKTVTINHIRAETRSGTFNN